MDKKRVLIVDDDVDLLNMLKLRVESAGYEFDGAQDADEMFEIMQTRCPDVVVLDIVLPKKDGYSALREMRKVERFKDIPVIILTAKEKQKVGDLFALENIAYFIEKPFETNDLLKKINDAMGQQTA
ncbi:MAG: response regulator [Candidatus Omnitrophica bacterium]|nr:response regulator [Candidatus Omnitrophota bacterium]MBU1853806.1 response regulator [Candidatus Omnitrophota bacterium]